MADVLADWLRAAGVPAGVVSITPALATAGVKLSQILRTAPLRGLQGVSGTVNVQGEAQKQLDLVANDLFLQACTDLAEVSFAVSEELDDAVPISPQGQYAVIFDPLDGSSNLDVNITVGTIFSILPARSCADLLQAGVRQVLAGFISYGPSTDMVLACGKAVSMFTLAEDGRWQISAPQLRVPEDGPEIAINPARHSTWDAPTRAFVESSFGAEGAAYNARWVGSMIAEVQRILVRGGVFLYPEDVTCLPPKARLRLMYEANPIAYIIEAAGGTAICGRQRMLEMQPVELHQRVAVALGSCNELRRLQDAYLA